MAKRINKSQLKDIRNIGYVPQEVPIINGSILDNIFLGDSDLKKAMKMISETQFGPKELIPSMGCNIKWFN